MTMSGHKGKNAGGFSLRRLALFIALLALAGLLNKFQIQPGTSAANDEDGEAAQVAVALRHDAASGASGADSAPGAPGIGDDGVAPRRAAIDRNGEYTGKEEVAAYIRAFNGSLPRNFITKGQARELGWSGGPLEPFAPGKSIGGDSFGNFEGHLPNGSYRECDIDTRGRQSRGGKRLVYTRRGERIYYTGDHYRTFEEVMPEGR